MKIRLTHFLYLTLLLITACAAPPASPAPASTQANAPLTPPPAALTVTVPLNSPAALTPTPELVDSGQPQVTDLWVDALRGSDQADGLSAETALQTLSAAWEKIPSAQELAGGYRIRLQPGNYPEQSLPVYWEARYGSFQHPIVVQGQGSSPEQVNLQAFVNVYDSRYLYFENLSIQTHGDVFHCEKCDHLLIRNVIMNGFGEAHEVLKVNQSQYVYVENSDLSGAYENALDFVAVQFGHLVGSRLHEAADWCGYVKGGSAYLRVEGNEFFNCGTGGFTAGQGTGFQYMVAPWLTYEAFDIRVLNNLIHDTEGAGLGVNGGYNILLAHNTLYRVGSRSHVLEVVYGARSCDGQPGDEGRERCQQYLQAGGWGTTQVDNGENYVNIGNRNIWIYNNIIYNPAGFHSTYQQFAIYGPRQNPAGSGLDLAVSDDNLQIKGNLIWNGETSQPLGIEGPDEGCQPENPTCNEAQLRTENVINRLEPHFADPAGGDFTPQGDWLTQVSAYPIPEFGWELADIPAGQAANPVTRDFIGRERAVPLAGAWLP
jgi:hypothetical protein